MSVQPSTSTATGLGRTTTEKRFIAAFGAVLIVVGVAAYMTLAGLEQVHDEMHRSVVMSRSLIRTHRIETAIHQTYAHQAHTIILGDDSHLPMYESTNAELLERIERARASSDGDRGAIVDATARTQAESDRAFRERLLPAVLAGDVHTVRAEHDELLARMNALEGLLDVETNTVEAQLMEFQEHVAVAAHSGYRNTLIMLVGVAIFTAIVGVALGRSVAKPIALLRAGARRIADGDSTARLPVTGPAEFRSLAVQFNDMVVATRENQAKLLEAERLASIGRLSAGVAHEINNPLGVIRGYTKLVWKRVPDPDVRADLQVIEDECVRCHEIVRGLLDLSRPPVDQPEAVELRVLISELLDRMDHGAPGRRVHATVQGDARAWADPRALRQVLMNLMNNALDASPDGAVGIQISSNGAGVRVAVTDHGPGVGADVRPRLFEPFFTTKETGTGLGLAVSRAIARAHGGDVTYQDRPGGGAVFTLRLPAAPTERPE